MEQGTGPTSQAERAGDAELLHRYYEAWNERALEGVQPFWTDDFEWQDAPEIPGGGAFRGSDEVAQHFVELADAIGPMPVKVLEITPGRPEEYLVVLDVEVAGSIGGVSVGGPIYEAVRVREGKLARIRLFLARDQALEAVGLA